MIFEKNLNDFLNDISAQAPTGVDVRYLPIYDKIQESLREDLDLPQGVWIQDLKVADWRGAETLCIDTLQKQTKDLQIASWLAKIWMSIYQIQGLKNGLDLILKLSEKYWDTIYPLPQNGDPEFRMAPFLWLNEKLARNIHRITITAPINASVEAQTYARYLAVRDYLYQQNSPPAEIAQDINDFQSSLSKTPSTFFIELNKAAEETIHIAKNLEAFLDTKFGKDAPTLYHMREVLEGFSQYCQQILSSRGESSTEKQKEEQMESNPLKPVLEDVSGRGSLKNREDAYRAIQEAADFLYKLEPHSPAPFLIRKAISWGHLSFEELMHQVLQDAGSVADMRRLLGLDSNGTQLTSSQEDNKSAGQQAPWIVEQSN